MTRSVALLVIAIALAGCATTGPLVPVFSGADRERGQVGVRLKPVLAAGVEVQVRQPTDLAFLPEDERGHPVLLVSERSGGLRWFDLRTGDAGTLLSVNAWPIEVEQGFLGFTLHPDFPRVPEIYTHHIAIGGGLGGRSVLTRWRIWGDDVRSMTAEPEVLLEVVQPQAAHNGGQVRFGPDGFLYLGLGDGGWQGDPANRAQNRKDLLGTILRLDVAEDGPYRVPADNPFVGGGHRPEVWAFGFRNPWRFDWSSEGTLYVADVGQDRIEEIDRVEAGGNYGWSLREGTACYGQGRVRPGSCDDEGLIDPVYEYRRNDGRAIVGGRFYEGRKLDPLAGRFVFGDYTSGRLWAFSEDASPPLLALGGFGVAPVAFGEDAEGELYLAVQGGRIYRLVPGGRRP